MSWPFMRYPFGAVVDRSTYTRFLLRETLETERTRRNVVIRKERRARHAAIRRIERGVDASTAEAAHADVAGELADLDERIPWIEEQLRDLELLARFERSAEGADDGP